MKFLVGKSPYSNSAAAARRRSQMTIIRANNTDDSFGYNFDEQPPSQRVSAILESSGHKVD
jgi:hypothetical protein